MKFKEKRVSNFLLPTNLTHQKAKLTESEFKLFKLFQNKQLLY